MKSQVTRTSGSFTGVQYKQLHPPTPQNKKLKSQQTPTNYEILTALADEEKPDVSLSSRWLIMAPKNCKNKDRGVNQY